MVMMPEWAGSGVSRPGSGHCHASASESDVLSAPEGTAKPDSGHCHASSSKSEVLRAPEGTAKPGSGQIIEGGGGGSRCCRLGHCDFR